MNTEERKIVAWSFAWEGFISVQKRNGKNVRLCQPILGVSNTNKNLLEQFSDMVGCGNITKVKTTKKNNAQVWHWRVSNLPDVAFVLSQIVSYLPSKREAGKLVLDFCVSRLKKARGKPLGGVRYDDFELQLVDKIRALQEAGKSHRTVPT